MTIETIREPVGDLVKRHLAGGIIQERLKRKGLPSVSDIEPADCNEWFVCLSEARAGLDKAAAEAES